MNRRTVGVLAAEMQMPVAVGANAVFVHVRVHVKPARHRQPTDDQTKHDQEAAAEELAALLEPHRNLPAEKQHEPGAEGEQKRMAHGKSQRQPECARVTGGAERRGERQGRDRHQMIGAEAVEKPESEHGTGEHGADYS